MSEARRQKREAERERDRLINEDPDGIMKLTKEAIEKNKDDLKGLFFLIMDKLYDSCKTTAEGHGVKYVTEPIFRIAVNEATIKNLERTGNEQLKENIKIFNDVIEGIYKSCMEKSAMMESTNVSIEDLKFAIQWVKDQF